MISRTTDFVVTACVLPQADKSIPGKHHAVTMLVWSRGLLLLWACPVLLCPRIPGLLDRPLQSIAMTRPPSLPPHPGQIRIMLLLLPFAQTAYAAAAHPDSLASLPSTATNHVTCWRSSASVVSFARVTADDNLITRLLPLVGFCG